MSSLDGTPGRLPISEKDRFRPSIETHTDDKAMTPEPANSIQPLPGVLWYHGPKALTAGGLHAIPFCEEPVKAPRTLAGLSLGLVGFAFAGCGPQGSATARNGRLRSVEPRLTDGAAYATCRTGTAAGDLIPEVVCGPARRHAERKPAAERRPATRGAEASAGAEETGIALGDLLSQEGVRDTDRAVRRLETAVGVNPRDARTWSDLAAAYLVRAQRANDPRDLL